MHDNVQHTSNSDVMLNICGSKNAIKIINIEINSNPVNFTQNTHYCLCTNTFW